MKGLKTTKLCGALAAAVAAACGDLGLDEQDTERAPDLTMEPIAELGSAALGKTFGTFCENDELEINPQTNKPWETRTGSANCGGFTSQFKDTASRVFAYNLHGVNNDAKLMWETSADTQGLETVDMVFAALHGGANDEAFVHNTWYDGYTYPEKLIWSNAMSLGTGASGTSQPGLSILATFSCLTMQNDNRFFTRWDSVFQGGLRMALASHGDVASEPNTDYVGAEFGKRLKGGSTFRDAWYSALAKSSSDNDIANMASGSTEANCHSRRTGMTWANFNSATYGRLKGANMVWICMETWDNK